MRHEKVVQALRAYKRRKREWQERMEKELTAREERVRQRRAEVDALFDDWEMIALDLQRLNELAPYKLDLVNGQYLFETDYGIQYAISFDPEPMPEGMNAYWFNLSNRSQKASPGDQKIRSTIIFLIEEFFRQNPDILLYMCDSANDQQAMRSRLFLRWFKAYGNQEDYYLRTEMIRDEEEENYIAIIVKRSHPRYNDIVAFFDEQVAMFKSEKPDNE